MSGWFRKGREYGVRCIVGEFDSAADATNIPAVLDSMFFVPAKHTVTETEANPTALGTFPAGVTAASECTLNPTNLSEVLTDTTSTVQFDSLDAGAFTWTNGDPSAWAINVLYALQKSGLSDTTNQPIFYWSFTEVSVPNGSSITFTNIGFRIRQ